METSLGQYGLSPRASASRGMAQAMATLQVALEVTQGKSRKKEVGELSRRNAYLKFLWKEMGVEEWRNIVDGCAMVVNSAEEATACILQIDECKPCLLVGEQHYDSLNPRALEAMLPSLCELGYDSIIWEQWYIEDAKPKLFESHRSNPEIVRSYESLLTKAGELSMRILPGNSREFNDLKGSYESHVEKRYMMDPFIANQVKELMANGNKPVVYVGRAHIFQREGGIAGLLQDSGVDCATLMFESRFQKPTLGVPFSYVPGEVEQWTVIQGDKRDNLIADYIIVAPFKSNWKA